MGWTDEQVEELKKLWDQGLTTGEIGKALGVSKNAVVGKAHRLKLDSRPSPIRRGEDELPLEEPATAEREKSAETAAVQKPVDAKPAAPKPAPVKKAADKKEKKKLFTVNDLTTTSCRWPIGDPKDEDFHFCGKTALPDKPYCAEHAMLAYVATKSSR